MLNEKEHCNAAIWHISTEPVDFSYNLICSSNYSKEHWAALMMLPGKYIPVMDVLYPFCLVYSADIHPEVKKVSANAIHFLNQDPLLRLGGFGGFAHCTDLFFDSIALTMVLNCLPGKNLLGTRISLLINYVIRAAKTIRDPADLPEKYFTIMADLRACIVNKAHMVYIDPSSIHCESCCD